MRNGVMCMAELKPATLVISGAVREILKLATVVVPSRDGDECVDVLEQGYHHSDISTLVSPTSDG